MTRWRITAVKIGSDGNISHVKINNGPVPISDVIDAMTRLKDSFYTIVHNKEIEIHSIENKYISTNSDSYLPNNLLKLPQF